jgi:hypothetical protein
MKITSFAVIALLLIAVTSNSQTIKQKSIYAKQMTFEIGGDIMLNSTEYNYEQILNSSFNSSSTITDLIIDGTAGIFVVDGLKLSVEPAIQLSYPDRGSSFAFLKIYFAPEYIVNVKSNIYPYLGGALGYSSLSSSQSNYPTRGGFSWGLKGGIKINAFGNALINIGLTYYRETYDYSDSYSGDVKDHHNILGFKAGLSLFFR